MHGKIGIAITMANKQNTIIMKQYWIFRIKSLSLSDLNMTTGMMNGNTIMLNGKKVIVILP